MSETLTLMGTEGVTGIQQLAGGLRSSKSRCSPGLWSSRDGEASSGTCMAQELTVAPTFPVSHILFYFLPSPGMGIREPQPGRAAEKNDSI